MLRKKVQQDINSRRKRLGQNFAKIKSKIYFFRSKKMALFITFNFAPNEDLLLLNEDWCFVPISLQLQISVMSFTIYVRYQNDFG